MPNSKIPFVTVLILSYNGKHLLSDALPSYLTNDYENFNIIVIDNGSNDGTEQFVKMSYPTVNVIRLENNKGYSGGFNFGLEYAFKQIKSDFVLISNNDVKADEKVISSLVKTAESNPTIGFVTGKVYYFDNPNIIQSVGKHEDPISWNGNHIGQGEKDQGQFDIECERIFTDDIYMLIPRRMYEQIGGYDETFKFQAEEFDYQARAKRIGYKVYYTPFAKLWHKESMTIGKRSAFKAFYNARNPMLVILKHKNANFFKRYFWHTLYYNIIKESLFALWQLRPLVAFNIWKGFISGLWWGITNRMLTKEHFF